MAKLSHISRSLYLSENVNVVIKEEPQHVINGVRFIYKQFVKEKPGVILNDPADYDQQTQVSLFLNATLNGPHKHFKTILILCDTTKLAVWIECLKKWMPDFDEVAIDWPKPTSKKSVYLVTTDRLEAFCRREWDLLVVDDDSFLQYKLTPKEFKIGFKIFITADDLKENLHKFSQIYRWLYPDKKIDVYNFRPNKNSISDILQKRMWFGAFVDDILIRNAGSLVQVAANTYREVPKDPEPRGITRKNKDATGTKIKRSKRKLEEDNTDTDNKKILAPSDYNDRNENIDVCDSKLDLSNIGEDQPKLDVESFIRDQEPLKMEELTDMSDIDENMSHTSEKMDIPEAEIEDGSDGEASNSMKLNYSEDTVNSDDAYCLETQDNGVDDSNLKFKENTDANIEENETFITDTNVKEDNVTNIDANITIEKSECDNLALCSKVEDGQINNKSNSVGTHTEKEIASKENGNTDVKDDTKKIAKADDLDSTSKENGNTDVKDDTKIAKANDLDSKWEEMAFKKFKGSLLDRIF